MTKKKVPKAKGKRRGPKPARLKIEGDWVAAIGKAMKAGNPTKKTKKPRMSLERSL